ncbi:hypothetical protein LTR53_012811 [Teratosphaeriaceae sp. CCFEE 6253]|nr:hypothetical protein LTR53_012811 [Teratosphaeriaceae sp. CCFEE 6253]
MTAMIIGATSAAPATHAERSDHVGWTHEEYLEYISLNSTDGWPGMSKVTYYNATAGEMIDFGHTGGLNKRAGNRWFYGWYNDGCTGSLLFAANNFGCGCLRQLAGQRHGCERAVDPGASRQSLSDGGLGIVGSQTSSCDNADGYGVEHFASAMLYQGC